MTETFEVSTTDIVHVRRARRVGPYRLKIWFTDETVGEWSFSHLAQGVA